MKVVFVGGGSYRLVPIVRGLLARGGILQGGEVRLVDRVVPRAEAVGRMIRRTPEFAGSDLAVTWGDDLDRALEGADALYVTMAVGDPGTLARSHRESRRRGFLSSDNLSLTGGFLGLTAGPTILDFARRMERRCPEAWMLIFANPVAVYSAAVNNHTSIRALGICMGERNHGWDLCRLMGRETFDPAFDLHVSGINHLSFILRGRWRGKDLYRTLARHLQDPAWRPPRVHPQSRWLEAHIHAGLRRLRWMQERFGVVLYSTEGDGMAHLFYEEMFQPEEGRLSRREVERLRRRGAKARKAADAEYRSYVDAELPEGFWDEPGERHRWFARDDRDVTLRILGALAGRGGEDVVASRPHRGAVAGMPGRTVLEFSQRLTPKTCRPRGRDYAIPHPFRGLIAALAEHQTLLGDAVATEDPRILADALYCYPVQQGSRNAREAAKALLAVHAEAIPAAFRQTADYLTAPPS